MADQSLGRLDQIQANQALPVYPGNRSDSPVPDPKIPACLRLDIPLSATDAGQHWFDYGQAFVAQHREALEQRSLNYIPCVLKAAFWNQKSEVIRTFGNDVLNGLDEIMVFAVEIRHLKQQIDAACSSDSPAKKYRLVVHGKLSCTIAKEGMPSYKIDACATLHSTRPNEKFRLKNDQDVEVCADHVMAIFSGEQPIITRDTIRSSDARVLAVVQFMRWGMLKAESFQASIPSQQMEEEDFQFNRDCNNLLQEAASQAVLWNTAFVALCDGESVVLIEFNEDILHPGRTTEQTWRTNLGSSCKMVVLQNYSGKIRATMLGWMLEALDKTVKNDSNILKQI